MANYVTAAEVYAYAYQKVTGDEALLTALIPRASRLFDREAGLPDNYFAAYVDPTAAGQRDFWGDGTDYLKIDPYLSTLTPTISMPSGFTAPDFIEATHQSRPRLCVPGEFFLVRTYGDNAMRFSGLSDRRDLFPADFSGNLDYVGWPDGIRVQVTAKWGFDAVPEDVKEAVIETVVTIWRSRDTAFARAVAIDTNTLLFDALPPRAKLIAERYRASKFAFA